MRRTTRLVTLGAVLLALAACQTGQGGGDVPDDVVPGGDTDPRSDDGGADLVFQVRSGGGFVPYGWDFRQVPSLTVYGDGRAIVHGPVTLQYPGAALPNLRDVRLADGAVEQILTAAEEAGLLAPPPDYGMPGITDVPTTTVTIVADGETYEHAVYAFGMESATVPEGGEAWDDGLTDAQHEARAALAAVVQKATELADAGAASGEEAYEIPGVALLAIPAGSWGDPELTPAVLPWPLPSVALADAASCAAVVGDDAVPLLDVLRDASELTQFEQDGVAYQVFVRPLLPHESSCSDLGM